MGCPRSLSLRRGVRTLRVANMILGRLGLMGRLGASVRERQGMAYYAASSLAAGFGRGMWTAYAGVDPANIDRAIESILEEVDKLRKEPVTDEELADAKSYLIGSLPLSMESSDSIADAALDVAFYHSGSIMSTSCQTGFARSRPKTCARRPERYLLTDRMAIAVAKPAPQAIDRAPSSTRTGDQEMA